VGHQAWFKSRDEESVVSQGWLELKAA
jgi:uncharacterized protein (DUF1684 family)